jgi:hypothetical protein
MPSRAARMCRVPSCAHLVRDSRPCPAHGAVKPWQGAHHAVYGTREHQQHIRIVRERDLGIPCGICHRGAVGRDGRRTAVDHRIPLSRGGACHPDNERLVHYDCNTRAGSALGAQTVKARAQCR